MNPGCTGGFEDDTVRRYREDEPLSPVKPKTAVDDEKDSQSQILEKDKREKQKEAEKEQEKSKENQKKSDGSTATSKEK